MTKPFDYSINITTTPFSNGIIEQEVNVMSEIRRTIYEAQDEGLKQALMQLGWLPPEEVHKLESKIYKLECDLIDALNSAWDVNT